MKTFIKILAVSLAFAGIIGVASGCGEEKKPPAASVSSANTMQKPSAQSVISAYNTENYSVEVEKKDLYNMNKVTVDSNTVLNVNENAASGLLNGIILTISDVKTDRDAKLKKFYTEIKKIIMACDSSVTSERADELVAYLKQAEPTDPSYYSTRSVKENLLSYTVSYSPEEFSFVVT